MVLSDTLITSERHGKAIKTSRESSPAASRSPSPSGRDIPPFGPLAMPEQRELSPGPPAIPELEPAEPRMDDFQSVPAKMGIAQKRPLVWTSKSLPRPPPSVAANLKKRTPKGFQYYERTGPAEQVFNCYRYLVNAKYSKEEKIKRMKQFLVNFAYYNSEGQRLNFARFTQQERFEKKNRKPKTEQKVFREDFDAREAYVWYRECERTMAMKASIRDAVLLSTEPK